jgi:hypothetical protein
MHFTPRITLTVCLAILAATTGGCATGGMGRAHTAERNEDYDRAIVEYNKILSQDPDDLDARLALDRAKLRASNGIFRRADGSWMPVSSKKRSLNSSWPPS